MFKFFKKHGDSDATLAPDGLEPLPADAFAHVHDVSVAAEESSASSSDTIELDFSMGEDDVATEALQDAPRGKHARLADVPEIKLPVAQDAQHAPAATPATQDAQHAPAATADMPFAFSTDAAQPTMPLAQQPVSAAAGAPAAAGQTATFEQDFFAANGFDMAEKPKGRGKRAAKIAGISVAAALVVAYGVGVGVFMGHFYPNTTSAGVDLSMKTVDEASNVLAAGVVDYSIAIGGKDIDLTISGSDIDFSFSGEDVAAKMHDSVNPWLWPYEVFQEHDTSDAYTTDFDATKLDAILEAAIEEHNATAQPTQDAKLGYVESAGKIGIVPEQYGTELVPHTVIVKVNDAVSKAQRKVTLDDSDVVAPTVLSTDQGLAKAAANAQQISHADVKLTIDGESVAEITAKQYADWLVIGEDYSVSVDSQKMDDYISSLVDGFNTVGSERTYTRPDGREVTVSGGTYGWEVDTDQLRANIQDAMANNTSGSIEVPVWQAAQVFSSAGGQDWGSRYVDVDMSEQYVRFYDNGEVIWESDCITGAGWDYDRMTPEGVYAITQKTTNEPLRPYENGRQVEEAIYVSYWMPFIGNMIGLHDAWWQPYFGGTAYLDGLGSHGCVNLPSYAAEELFYLIEVGDVVVTHY